MYWQSSVMLRNLLLAAIMLTITGCGDVSWFPEYKRLPTTPDIFTFPNKTGVPIFATVSSAAITVAGLTATSSPISITGPTGSNSKYSINGATSTDAAGTVANGNTVKVLHTSANNAGAAITSTLTIGNVTGTFTSITRTVATPSFSAPTLSGSFVQATATLSTLDTASGHTISIRDSLSSTNAQFSLLDANGDALGFSNATRTFGILNNQRIVVRNLLSTSTVTTLTIDGFDFVVDLTP